MPSLFIARWDIFCTVIDNYGDIGVCWRLAKQLAHEQQQIVRLFVDDLRSFERICPAINPQLTVQQCQGVEVHLWSTALAVCAADDIADIVIEAFACTIPDDYIRLMAERTTAPVWLNLEYLSAEEWTVGCHAMRSPHPRYPLQKTFFFPGFVEGTGGLLCEQSLITQRDSFLNDADAQKHFWQSLKIPAKAPNEIRVFLFGYDKAVDDLISTWAQSSLPISVCIPQGALADHCLSAYHTLSDKGLLRMWILPFIEQSRFDLLLWACDINFVRGEDSFVRAQWAGKPFIWQIYRQEDNAHLVKLDAFLDRYLPDLSAQDQHAINALWQAWNRDENCAALWPAFVEICPRLQTHNQQWLKNTQKIGYLCTNLMIYCQKYL